MSIHTKTSLKSVKKGDLVEMYLELQGKYNDVKMDVECEDDGYPVSDWFTSKLNFHIKYHFTNEGGEYYKPLKYLSETPDNLDELIYGTLEKLKEENEKLKEDLRKHKVAYNGASEERNEVKKENEKIKKTLVKFRNDNDILREKWIKSRAYGIKLEKENEKLKEELAKYTEKGRAEIYYENVKYYEDEDTGVLYRKDGEYFMRVGKWDYSCDTIDWDNKFSEWMHERLNEAVSQK